MSNRGKLLTRLASCATLPFMAISMLSAPMAHAQTKPQIAAPAQVNNPDLAPDSPFQDPNVIYLEADELVNDDAAKTLNARGNVIGRYQDRSILADEVTYNSETGQVIASGNVVLTDPSGVTQYADKLELSGELEAGTATNFTVRFEEGGILGASIVVRNEETGIELYNAYYTACEPCKGKKNPSWQIKARKVTQNKGRSSIEYKDAVFQFLGVPLFYTPYLSHPDPSADRQRGFMAPYAGYSGSTGIGAHAPFFVPLGRYAEVTLTPHVYTGVRPVLGYDFLRRFNAGDLHLAGSFTYGSAFDRKGNAFDDPSLFTVPADAPTGQRMRSHFFGDGLFEFGDTWTLGFGAQFTSDDLYLDRYNFEDDILGERLFETDSRRLISQAFAVAQTENMRLSFSTLGFQSLRTTIIENPGTGLLDVTAEDDSRLPIAIPKIEATHFMNDPILGGRLEVHGDFTMLSRKAGEDYMRGSGGVNYEKTMITPGGIEVKPFANTRFDYVEIDPQASAKTDFSRNLGQVGVDVRWPFMKSTGHADLVIEPRVQITQSFGSGELGNYSQISSGGTSTELFQDSVGMDFDRANFWASNKSLGYDFWQKGLRADVGADFSAHWADNRASVFLGQSYASDTSGNFAANTGLSGQTSDIVLGTELALGNKLNMNTRVRYDDNNKAIRRIDSSVKYVSKRFDAQARYYKLKPNGTPLTALVSGPLEEMSGEATVRFADYWGLRYAANRDMDSGVMRRQELGLVFDDDCTRVEIFYQKSNNDIGVIGSSSSIGMRFELLTFGGDAAARR